MSDHQAILAHHFQDVKQQNEASVLGMWTFLVTEIMLFGGLFVAFLIYRQLYPAAFAEASHHLNVMLATVNTAVLLGSSLTMAMAVHAVQTGKRKTLTVLLLLTALLGAAFLGIKGVEYYAEYKEQLIPGLNFALDSIHAGQVQIFFLLYFAMTGLHAIHLSAGILLVLVMAIRAWRNDFSKEHFMPVELTGLYWHFVDVVWVFLFPLLYLLDI